MIRLILLYLAIGLLLVTKYSWDELVRYFEENYLPKPFLVLAIIGSCFITPICLIIGVIQGLIEEFRGD